MNEQKLPAVAYFCMEYGLHSDFKMYAGGLGILAGDYIKGAKDYGAPIVAVGIKWKQGYTDQRIGPDGKPYDTFENRDYDFLEDTEVTVTVKVRSADVRCKVWKTEKFGNAPLYLLDTDLPGSGSAWITERLYGEASARSGSPRRSCWASAASKRCARCKSRWMSIILTKVTPCWRPPN